VDVQLAGVIVDGVAAVGTLAAVVVALVLAARARSQATRDEQRNALLSVIDVANRYQPPVFWGMKASRPPGPDLNDAKLPFLLLPSMTATVARLFLGETLNAEQLAKSRRYSQAPDPVEMIENPEGPPLPGLMCRDLREPVLAELHDDLQALR
jgi:hypothetical protein